ncbi:guanine nucleotide regulatory protein [Halenospora varia]|nr:guanine nucleotide regulatory protein [Halenospora varia]
MLITKEMSRSRKIDRTLEAESKRLKKVATALVLGDPNSSQKIVQIMKIMNQSAHTDEERRLYHATIRRNLVTIMEAMVSVLQTESDEFDESLTRIKGILLQDLQKGQHADTKAVIAKSAAMAIQSLWRHDRIRQLLLKSKKWKLADSPIYFVEKIIRMADRNYLPNEADILKSSTQPIATGIYETDIPWGGLSIHIVDISGQGSKVHKWMHSFENVTSIMFSVDLCTYDHILPENSTTTKLQETLLLFASIVNSRFFKRTSIILFFCNVKRFEEKMHHSPLSNYFLDYTGGNDVNRATKFLLWRFIQVNRANLPTYPQLAEEDSYPNHAYIIFTAIKGTLLNNALRDSGILEFWINSYRRARYWELLGLPSLRTPE